MKEGEYYELVLRRSPLPFLTGGAMWALLALAIPYYAWWQYLLCGLPAAVVYAVAARVFPPKLSRRALPRPALRSGVADVDRSISDATACLKRVEESGLVIAPISSRMASDLVPLIADGYRILDYLRRYPARASLLRRFLTYYLPTLSKLCSSYIEFRQSNTAAETTAEIEDAVAAMKDVFHRQLDKLYADHELDISSDIDVLEGMLEGDGLGKVCGDDKK